MFSSSSVSVLYRGVSVEFRWAAVLSRAAAQFISARQFYPEVVGFVKGEFFAFVGLGGRVGL